METGGGFFLTHISETPSNVKYMDKKIMRITHDLYIYAITPLVWMDVYPPPPHLEGFIGYVCGSAYPDAQPNPPCICQTPLPAVTFDIGVSL